MGLDKDCVGTTPTMVQSLSSASASSLVKSKPSFSNPPVPEDLVLFIEPRPGAGGGMLEVLIVVLLRKELMLTEEEELVIAAADVAA